MKKILYLSVIFSLLASFLIGVVLSKIFFGFYLSRPSIRSYIPVDITNIEFYSKDGVVDWMYYADNTLLRDPNYCTNFPQGRDDFVCSCFESLFPIYCMNQFSYYFDRECLIDDLVCDNGQERAVVGYNSSNDSQDIVRFKKFINNYFFQNYPNYLFHDYKIYKFLSENVWYYVFLTHSNNSSIQQKVYDFTLRHSSISIKDNLTNDFKMISNAEYWVDEDLLTIPWIVISIIFFIPMVLSVTLLIWIFQKIKFKKNPQRGSKVEVS